MLSLEISDFLIQLKEGSIHNVGGPNKAATAKLYDITEVEARAFGDERVKLSFGDDEGNNIEVALFPDEVEHIQDDLEEVRASGAVEGFGPTE